MVFRNVFSTFEARQSQHISGVSKQTQRDWRFHGYLERAGEGRANHDAFDLARLVFMRALADRGVGPADSSKIAPSAALRIAYFAMCVPSAFEDKTGGEFTRGMKARNRPLASAFVQWKHSKHDPARYLVTTESGSISFTNDIAAEFAGKSFDQAVFVLDLKTLGETIAERAGRPLVTVEKR